MENRALPRLPRQAADRRIALQVGERQFVTTREALVAESGFFASLLSGRWVNAQETHDTPWSNGIRFRESLVFDMALPNQRRFEGCVHSISSRVLVYHEVRDYSTPETMNPPTMPRLSEK